MEVSNEHFLLFYEKLWEKYKVHIDKLFASSGKDSAMAPKNLWDYWEYEVIGSQNRKIAVAELLFHASPCYFYKLKPKPGRKGQVSIRNNSFVKALEFTLEVPQEQLFQGGDWLTKATALWQLFVTPQKTHNVEHAFSVIDDIQNNTAYSKVLEFYDSIMKFEFDSAWNCMSDHLKKRAPWNNVYENFQKGFSFTSSIQDIAVFNPKERGTLVDFKVHYTDKINVYPIKGLVGISDLTIDDLSEKIKRLETIKKEIEARGGTDFGKIRFKDLYNPIASNLLFYYCDVSHDLVQHTFPRSKPVTVTRLVDVTCIKKDDQWLVNDISHVPVISIY